MRLFCWVLLVLSFSLATSFAGVRLLTGDANNRLYDSDAFLMDLSADGNLVLFVSGPPVVGAAPPGIAQGGLYIRNLGANTLTFSGVSKVAGEASLSDNGRYLAWVGPGNLLYWRDGQNDETRLITPGADNASRNPIISGDGRYVAYASLARNIVPNTALLPAEGRGAVYVYDSQTRSTTVASLTYDGKGLSTGVGLYVPQLEFDFSANGQFVFFSTDSANAHPARASAESQAYYWTYRRNLSNGQVDVVCRNATNAIPVGNFSTPRCDATGNRVLMLGSYVAITGGPTFVPGYTFAFGADLYLKDMTTAEVWWVSKTTNNSTSDSVIPASVINADGTVVAFGSSGSKYVVENTDPIPFNDSIDVFRVDIGSAGKVTTTLITKAVVGSRNVGVFGTLHLPGTGNYVAFGTADLFSMLGAGINDSFFKHEVAVGTIPGEPADGGSPLTVALSANRFEFHWTKQLDSILEFAALLSTEAWTRVTNATSLVDGVRSVSLPADAGTRFFRLRKP